MNIKNSIEAVHDKITDMGAKAMVAATNAAGRAMNSTFFNIYILPFFFIITFYQINLKLIFF